MSFEASDAQSCWMGCEKLCHQKCCTLDALSQMSRLMSMVNSTVSCFHDAHAHVRFVRSVSDIPYDEAAALVAYVGPSGITGQSALHIVPLSSETPQSPAQ